MHKVRINYNCYIIKNNDNICNISASDHEKRKTKWNLVHHKNWWFSKFHPHLNVNVFLLQVFFEYQLMYDQTQGLSVVFSLFFGSFNCSWFFDFEEKELNK
jgi:hypothetical protein